ncbi:MAG: response regulator [Coleofasciculus sp. S288]|nr:response regulator [Coleofasciculus sp. S288]
MKILLVEDDEPTAWALKETLSTHHYIVTIATDGQTGLELAQAFTYDLLLLDVLVPKMDGITLCRHLRSKGYQSPILLLTALDTSTDRVMGLDAGADDYVVKPVNLEELTARIRALLRRGNSTLPPVITLGELRFDPGAGEVSYGGKLLHLTTKEYTLLEFFLLNPRRVFSRSAIIDRLWPDEELPEEGTVTTHIKSLRKKLKAAGATANFIETVYGLGYRLKSLSEPQKSVSSAPSTGTGEAGRAGGVGEPGEILPLSATRHEMDKEPQEQQVIDSVSQLWEKFKGTFTAQVEVLEQAAQILSEGRLTIELQQKAKQEAHRLAGSLGIFGFAEGSKLARCLERLLETEGTIGQEQALPISELLGLLKQAIEKKPSTTPVTPTSPAPSAPSTSPARMLVIDDDVALIERLKGEATAWNIQIDVASDLKTAREAIGFASAPNAIASTPPDIILLDLTFPASIENGLTLLAELATKTPQIPVIAFTSQDSLSDRVEVVRLGGRAFLHKPVSTEQIFQTVTQVLNRVRPVEAKVMVVDDDPIVLATVCSLLKPWGMDVTTLENSQRFWEVLSAEAPDLLILDLEMPKFSGIELCQVVRNDPQWSELPILFLTAHTEKDAINQAFAAGADDYISKPIVEQELVTRIVNRLERVHWRQKRVH